MIRLSGAFVTRFMEAGRASGLLPPLGMDDLGTSPEDHRHVEEFLERMKYQLVEVLVPEASGAKAETQVPQAAGH
jgi:hypothetical protein